VRQGHALAAYDQLEHVIAAHADVLVGGGLIAPPVAHQ
jgi:hypothetical protein